MPVLKVTMTFGKPGYIAHPYSVAMYELIEIQKKSGMMRARSDKKRRQALEEYLRGINMTLQEFEALEKKAAEPFYKNSDGMIIIPSDKVMSSLVNASMEATAKIRIDNLRVSLMASDFVTDRKDPDPDKFDRFVVVTNATGKLSNQRSRRINDKISDFKATGTITYDPEMVDPKTIKALLEFGGRQIGIGASRKMGFGRYVPSFS